jgi:hypothetical protein
VRALAQYILRGPLQAALLATTCALLALLSPLTAPLSYLSGCAVALVTLRQGPQRGALALLTTAAATAVLGELAIGSFVPAVVFTLALWVPLWLLAAVLHYTRSLALTVQLGGVLGLVWVGAMHGWLDNPAQWWRGVLEDLRPALEQAEQRAGVKQDVGPLLDAVAAQLTGALAAVLALSTVLNLMLARWWQAVVFNPGGFRAEFQSLRLDHVAAGAAVVLVVLALVGGAGLAAVAADMLWVVVAIYLLAGLGLVHGIVARTKAHVGWLVVIYAALTVAPVYATLLVAFLALADSWLDLRRYFPEAGT